MMQKVSGSKVVLQLPSGLVKGYLTDDSLNTVDPSSIVPKTISITLAENGEDRVFSLEDAKGIFFVKDFDGRTDHADLRFHDSATPAGYLWVRLTFLDGEVLECMLQNSCSYVVSAGLWVTPTDPTSNNWLIYASKSKLKHFEVLGLRQNLKSHNI